MGAKYTSQATTGYNSSPPADDGSQSASNLITWAGIKSKLADVLKTFGEAINTALVATLNLSARAISSADSAVAGDHWRSLEVTGTTTISLPDAATVGAGWVTTITNVGTGIVTIARTTGADKINGVAQNLNLSPGDAVTLKVNAAPDGFITDSARSIDLSRVEGRLTLTSGTPVTTADVTSVTAVKFTPYKGNKIALFDGTGTWNELAFSELSLTAAAAANTQYDVFAYNDAGTVSIEATAWTNDSSRATALTLQNGVLVKLGATTRRFLGTIRTTGIAGQLEDSSAKRFVWNYYNRVERPTFGALLANRTTTNGFAVEINSEIRSLFVIGVIEDSVSAICTGIWQNDTNSSTMRATVSVNAGGSVANNDNVVYQTIITAYVNVGFPFSTEMTKFPALGMNIITLNGGTTGGTATYIGAALGSTGDRTTIRGKIKG